MTEVITPYEFSFYANLAGEIFRVDATEGWADGAIELTVAEVTPSPPRGDKVPFSVLFQSNSAQALPQQIHRLTGARAGTVELFIVPVARNPAGIAYEAVFN